MVASRKAVIGVALVAKLTLLALAAATLLFFGAGYFRPGVWAIGAHVIVLLAILAMLFWGGLRHKSFLGGSMDHLGDRPSGIVLHGALAYDLFVKAVTFGREAGFRERLLRPAALRPGEAVLDVACGTGTLAIAAKVKVGPAGRVAGIDASPEMIERARAKAARAGADVSFVTGGAQALPFDDGQFDIVIGTLMLHHLPKPVRAEFAAEARRVLKPGGRLLLIDFGKPPRRRFRIHRHGHADMDAIRVMLEANGFEVGDVGAIGTKNLNYIRASRQVS